MDNAKLVMAFEDRVFSIRKKLVSWPRNAHKFFLAGGCLAHEIHDLDIFPVPNSPEPDFADDWQLLAKTKNAKTWRTKPWPTQMCNYRHDTLKLLVDSFDFAGVQVGALITSDGGRWAVDDVYISDAFIQARITGVFEFTGSTYPLASLFRLMKYADYGQVNKHDKIRATIKILEAVYRRGFSGWSDFKDQLDAVDLALVPEDFDGGSTGFLRDFYEALS